MTFVKSLNQRLPIRLKRAEFESQHYVEIIPAGIPFSEVMSTQFWSHVETRLRVYDIVEVIAEDGSFDADMRLVRKAPGRLEWRVLRNVSGAPVEGVVKPGKPARHELKWGGPRAKWTVKDKRTGKTLVEGYDKAEAQAELERLEAEAAA